MGKFWQDKGQQVQLGLMDQQRKTVLKKTVAGNQGMVEFSAGLSSVTAWSAERPYLYQLLITVFSKEEVVGVIPQKVSFRNIRVSGKAFLVSGMAIRLEGIDRHNCDPGNGQVVSRREIEKGIRLMRQFSINTIRTSHYPASVYFYDLCDEYGVYVIDEADLECRGFELAGEYGRISNDPEWGAVYVSRMVRMIQRDKNHPSILFWSLGNESAFGHSFIEMTRIAKEMDPTRLVHYRGGFEAEVTNVHSTMYT